MKSIIYQQSSRLMTLFFFSICNLQLPGLKNFRCIFSHFIGPSEILAYIDYQAYYLKLPPDLCQYHPVFYVYLLKLVPPTAIL